MKSKNNLSISKNIMKLKMEDAAARVIEDTNKNIIKIISFFKNMEDRIKIMRKEVRLDIKN